MSFDQARMFLQIQVANGSCIDVIAQLLPVNGFQQVAKNLPVVDKADHIGPGNASECTGIPGSSRQSFTGPMEINCRCAPLESALSALWKLTPADGEAE